MNQSLLNMPDQTWTLLIYKIPHQPSRLRVQIWRKLQRLGAVYLQDSICVLPATPELEENMQDIAASIEEMGGTCHLFQANPMLPAGQQRLMDEFRRLSDQRLEEILSRLEGLQKSLDSTAPERAEEELKRERVAYLRARRLAYFGSSHSQAVDHRLESLKQGLDELYRRDDEK